MQLKDKVAIVTGSSRGIGRAIALALGAEGAIVAVVARTDTPNPNLPGTITQTAEDIVSQGGRAVPIKTDISSEESVAEMVNKLLHEFSRIDILVNNAGTNRPVLFKDIQLKHWDVIFNVNFRGAVVCTKAVLPTMIEQERGSIVNVSSVAAQSYSHEPFTGLAYGVTKAAMSRFTLGLAEELKTYNIAVNALAPHNTVTEGWALLNPDIDKSSWQKPELWGNYAAFLASRDAESFTGKVLGAEELEVECARAGWSPTFAAGR